MNRACRNCKHLNPLGFIPNVKVGADYVCTEWEPYNG